MEDNICFMVSNNVLRLFRVVTLKIEFAVVNIDGIPSQIQVMNTVSKGDFLKGLLSSVFL